MKWTHTSLLEIILQLKGKVMADNVDQGYSPTSFGKKVGKIGASLWGTDPIYNQLPTRAGFQQAAQMGALPLALGRLAFGFGAPSIEPAAREARRQFNEEILPSLEERYAGGGSRGALLRGIQGAKGDLESKLGALKFEKEFELQKLRQEMIPKIMELGMSPSFQTHLTNRPIQGLPQTTSAEFAASPIGQKAAELGQFGQDIGVGGLQAAQDIGARVGTGGTRLSADALRGIEKRFPDFFKKMQSGVQGLEQYTRPAYKNLTPKQAQQEFEQTRTINELVRKAKLPNALAKLIKPEHAPMIKELIKRKRGRQELAEITNPDDIELLYNYWQKHPSKRSKIGDFFKSLVGKKRK